MKKVFNPTACFFFHTNEMGSVVPKDQKLVIIYNITDGLYGSKFFPFRIDPFCRREVKSVLTKLIPGKVCPFP